MAHSKGDGTGSRRPHAASSDSNSSTADTHPTTRHTNSQPHSRVHQPSVSDSSGSPSSGPAGSSHRHTGSTGSNPPPPPAPTIAALHRPMTPPPPRPANPPTRPRGSGFYEEPTESPPRRTISSDSSPHSELSSDQSSVHASRSGGRAPSAAGTADLDSPKIPVHERFTGKHRHTHSDSSGTHLTAPSLHGSDQADRAPSVQSGPSVTSLDLNNSSPQAPLSPRQAMLQRLQEMRIRGPSPMQLDSSNGRSRSPHGVHRGVHPNIDRVMSGGEDGEESEDDSVKRRKDLKGKQARGTSEFKDTRGDHNRRGGSGDNGRDHGGESGEDSSQDEAAKRRRKKGKAPARRKDDDDDRHKPGGGDDNRRGPGSGSGGHAAGNADTQWHPYAGPSNQKKR